MARLRRLLDDAGYEARAVERLLACPEGAEDAASALAVRRAAGAGTLGALVLLFRLGAVLPAADAAVLLSPLDLDELSAAGLLEISGNGVSAPLTLLPYDGLIVAGDPAAEAGARDFVTPVSGSSRWLAEITIRRRVRTALDVGTGSGVQALLASRHAERVVATDVNPRALAIGRLNAGLNGIASVEWAEGNWLQPVAGERFDLIVANPPFAISPDGGLLYRDSGAPGDATVRALLRALPDHLEDGGIAQVVCDWVCPPEGDPAAPVRAWLEGRGCDVLVLWRKTLEPLDYAAFWNASFAQEGEVEEALTRWTSHYAQEGIEAFARGSVLLRRRPGSSNWFHALEERNVHTAPAGDGLARIVAGRDALARLPSKEALLDLPLGLAPGLRVEQLVVWQADGFRRRRAALSAEPGAGVEALVDPDALDVLFALPDSETVRAAADDDAELLALGAAAARLLLERGLLEPAGEPRK